MWPFASAWALAWTVAWTVACGGREANSHVYQSPPPSSVPGTHATPAPVTVAAPEPPIGTTGPIARIVSINTVATGDPVSLQHVAEPFTILGLASRGPSSSPARPMRLELRLVGPSDTVLIERLDAPVPFVIAHQFELRVGRGRGLRPGSYHAVVGLVDDSGHDVAVSVPLYFAVTVE